MMGSKDGLIDTGALGRTWVAPWVLPVVLYPGRTRGSRGRVAHGSYPGSHHRIRGSYLQVRLGATQGKTPVGTRDPLRRYDPRIRWYDPYATQLRPRGRMAAGS